MCCDDHSINEMDKNMALVCLILNIFIPGIGTIINGATGHNHVGIVYGILQFFLTGFFLIGWVWSIIYGVKIVNRSAKGDYHKQNGHDNHHHDHHHH